MPLVIKVETRFFFSFYSPQKIATDYRCKGMPLSSFLLKPMQRITRYPLHIKNVGIMFLSVSVSELLIKWFEY